MADELRGMTIEEFKALQPGDVFEWVGHPNLDGLRRVTSPTRVGLRGGLVVNYGYFDIAGVSAAWDEHDRAFMRLVSKAAPSEAVRVEQLTADLGDAKDRIEHLTVCLTEANERIDQLNQHNRDLVSASDRRIAELEELVSVLVTSRDHQRGAAKTARRRLREAVGYLRPIVECEYSWPCDRPKSDDEVRYHGLIRELNVTYGHMRSARAFLASLDAGEDAPSCGCGSPGEPASADEAPDTTDGANGAPVGAEYDFKPDSGKSHWCDTCDSWSSPWPSRKLPDGRHLCPECFSEWAEERLRSTVLLSAPQEELDRELDEWKRRIAKAERDDALAACGEDARSLDAVRGDLRQCRAILAKTQEALRKKCDQLDAVRTQRDKAVAFLDPLSAWFTTLERWDAHWGRVRSDESRFLDGAWMERTPVTVGHMRAAREFLKSVPHDGVKSEPPRVEAKCDDGAPQGLAAMVGQWPGDETDEEIEDALRGMDGHDSFAEAAEQVVATLRERAARYGDTFGALGVRDALHDIASHVRSKASRVITGDGSADADSMLDIAGYGILGMVRLAQEGGE